jgi:pimeloyl-ACP methyl ester carboxylesterase
MARAAHDTDDFGIHLGRPDSTPIVMLPGLVAGSWIWEKTRAALTEAGHTCITVRDAIAVTHDSIEEAAVSLSTRLETLGIARATILGASLGSTVALVHALRHPDRVKSIVLSGAPARKGRVDLGIESFGKFTRPIAYQVATTLFFDRTCIGDDVVESTFKVFLNRRRLTNMVRLLREASTFDIESVLPRVKPDVLMVWGDNDRISRCEDWERLLPLVRSGAFVKVPRCGHLPMIERPEAFNAALFDFLSTRGGAAAAAGGA